MKRFLKICVFISFSSIFFNSCVTQPEKYKDARKAMREFVIKISNKGKKVNPNFVVIPQNGQPVAWDDDDNPVLNSNYITAIDGIGREDTFYGTNKKWELADGNPTPKNINGEFVKYCDAYKDEGVVVLSIDYTTNNSTKITDSFNKNNEKGYISFAAVDRNLRTIPTYEPFEKNSNDITSLDDAKNFLYLINPEKFSSKQAFINAISQTDYDVVIMDLFFNEKPLTKTDLEAMKNKKNGGKRLLVCYMSIGEAEDYRWYWKSEWNKKKPDFICQENSEWEGNYKVKYWHKDWQEIICGDKNSYLSKILNAGFDGVYLDIIDAYEYFE